MSYLVLARKWRPQTFSDLIGQEHVNQTLKNAIDSGRIAHAFLFTGARGVGKTSSARILAKALNCEQGLTPEPCNTCAACQEITAGNSVDVFEIDGASNTSVDDIRELRENIKYLPSRSRFKIFIIDEVHMLSTSAFNALLKTLEEPPAHIKFIFATTEPQKVPITILSRCQRFDFKRIPLPLLLKHLRHIVDHEQVVVSDAALAVIARKGDGSMRDSLSTLDQVLAFSGSNVRDEEVAALLGVVDRRLLLEASQAVFAGNCRNLLELVRKVDSFGYNMRSFCQELLDHFRNILLFKTVGAGTDLMELAENELHEIQSQAAPVELVDIQRQISLLLRAEAEMTHSTFPRLVLELALVKMATLPRIVPIDALLEQLKRLDNPVAGGLVASTSPSWQKSPQPVGAGEIARQGQEAQPAHNQSPSRNTPPQRKPAISPTEQTSAQNPVGEWEQFVGFVKSRKPLLASILEQCRPLQVSAGRLELGLAAGSFELSRFQDADVKAELQGLAKSFFQVDESTIIVKTITDPSDDIPPTLAEKKSLEAADHQNKLKQTAASHPLVTAVLEIFDGEIVKVRDNG